MCNAWFIVRFPRRDSRCVGRFGFPDDHSIGAVPLYAANLSSFAKRATSPVWPINVAATTSPIPNTSVRVVPDATTPDLMRRSSTLCVARRSGRSRRAVRTRAGDVPDRPHRPVRHPRGPGTLGGQRSASGCRRERAHTPGRAGDTPPCSGPTRSASGGSRRRTVLTSFEPHRGGTQQPRNSIGSQPDTSSGRQFASNDHWTPPTLRATPQRRPRLNQAVLASAHPDSSSTAPSQVTARRVPRRSHRPRWRIPTPRNRRPGSTHPCPLHHGGTLQSQTCRPVARRCPRIDPRLVSKGSRAPPKRDRGVPTCRTR